MGKGSELLALNGVPLPREAYQSPHQRTGDTYQLPRLPTEEQEVLGRKISLAMARQQHDRARALLEEAIKEANEARGFEKAHASEVYLDSVKDFPRRTLACLLEEGVSTVQDLLEFARLNKWHLIKGIGKTQLRFMYEALNKGGFRVTETMFVRKPRPKVKPNGNLTQESRHDRHKDIKAPESTSLAKGFSWAQ